MRTHQPVALSVAAPAAQSKSKLGAGPVAFDCAALRSGRTEKAPQEVRKCTNLLWSDLDLMGINNASMFPGLDGWAKSVITRVVLDTLPYVPHSAERAAAARIHLDHALIFRGQKQYEEAIASYERALALVLSQVDCEG